MSAIPEKSPPHISVCICTYKRPLPLKRLLQELSRQQTDGLFTFSAVVADNDRARTAEAAVAEFAAGSAMPVAYVAEPKRGIALARNKVVAHADGDYLGLIDDDEFPAPDWLLKMLLACREYGADGVLGPVIRYFDEEPPAWLKKSRLFSRPIHPSGLRVKWRESRTSNVLLKREVIAGDTAPFRPEFRAGEDQDFFYRKIEAGYGFVWSADAVVYEVIPPARWKRMYSVRRALLQGACESQLPVFGAASVIKSLIAAPVYLLILPFTLLLGGHRFMTIAEKLSYHLGKLLKIIGIDPIREEYISD